MTGGGGLDWLRSNQPTWVLQSGKLDCFALEIAEWRMVWPYV
jgi:hypothetical protein